MASTSSQNMQALYAGLSRSQAKAELRSWERRAARLVQRRELAEANLDLAQLHMRALRDRVKTAPAERRLY